MTASGGVHGGDGRGAKTQSLMLFVGAQRVQPQPAAERLFAVKKEIAVWETAPGSASRKMCVLVF